VLLAAGTMTPPLGVLGGPIVRRTGERSDGLADPVGLYLVVGATAREAPWSFLLRGRWIGWNTETRQARITLLRRRTSGSLNQ
jgi:hypothetical protein